ncbi:MULTISPECIES: transketolase [unclassified Sphingomonas]|uniref:transketolase n=1 Tax=unclassified Sphingomonas TaxID=196159 RepID=UPI000A7F44BB|nr:MULTISPECIES: transketolase [unclassified Sphingomonas]
MDLEAVRELAADTRREVLKMVHRAKASHVGSCFSIADMLAVLYGHVMSVDPVHADRPDRDRLIVSKGHAAAAVYAVLANRGFFPREWLDEYSVNGSLLTGHVSHAVPGVELSTGSLGHGLSVGAGLALGARLQGAAWRSFVILSDGECDEGSIWEAAMFAGHHQLTNLVALVDYNKIQSFGRVDEVLRLEPFADKWTSFGWQVTEVDGHDHTALAEALADKGGDKPNLLLCHTVKGRGVSFMEDRLEWHYKSPNDEQLAQAIAEIGSVQ